MIRIIPQLAQAILVGFLVRVFDALSKIETFARISSNSNFNCLHSAGRGRVVLDFLRSDIRNGSG